MTSIESFRSIFSLAGKTSIISGGSRGIGKALSEGLAAHGADVAIVVQSSVERAEVVANGIRAVGRDAMVIKADVSNEVDVQRMTDEVMERWGRIDILVNNAGIILPAATEDCSFGRIVNWPFHHAAYNVSKAGVHMLTKCLATEWAEHNIRVNALAPGYIMTELTAEVLREHPAVVNDQWTKGAVQNRVGSVEELVGAAIYLASSSASFTTGEIITIDGGFTLR